MCTILLWFLSMFYRIYHRLMKLVKESLQSNCIYDDATFFRNESNI